MAAIDLINPFKSLAALVVDDMAEQRVMARSQLFQMGIPLVEQASTPAAALAHLRKRHFDLVLCDFDLGKQTNGQQLLEHARSCKLLPPTTIFVMITGESRHAEVAKIADQVPDDFVLKPVSVAVLQDRIAAQLKRLGALAPVLARLEARDFEGAVQACDALLASGSRHGMELLRHKAESQFALGHFAQARQTYGVAREHRDQALWARMGEAVCLEREGKLVQAQQIAESLVSAEGNKNFVRAYDLLATISEKQGHTDRALECLRSAARIVPSANRNRAVGAAALRSGDLELARESMLKVFRETRGSVVARNEDIVALAQAQADTGQYREALAVLRDSKEMLARSPEHRRSVLAVTAMAQMSAGNHEEACLAFDAAYRCENPDAPVGSVVALAKAAFRLGRDHAGFDLLSHAVAADHENKDLLASARRALIDAGHADKLAEVVDKIATGLAGRIEASRRHLLEGRFDEALEAAERMCLAYPGNSAVLLGSAQAHLLWIRKKGPNPRYLARIRELLAKLDELLPGSERVSKLHDALRAALAVGAVGAAA